MSEIARTATEPATLTWLQDGAPVTGASPTMRVRRASDDYSTVYDWTALAFASPATAVAPFVALAPTDPTYEPGVYWHAFEPQSASNAVAPDIYRVTYYADATLNAPLGTAEIRVGTVDTLDALPATLAGAHGAGSWATASGFATAADVAASTAAIEAYGQAHWVTADVSGVPAAVWATAYGTPSANTFGWLAWRLAQWGTEIAQKRIVGQNLLLQSIGGGTTYATVPLKDISGGVITPATGEPAQYLP